MPNVCAGHFYLGHFDHFYVGLDIRAVGRLIKPGRRQDVVEMPLFDIDGRLISHATGTCLLLPDIPLSGNGLADPCP